MHGWITDGVGNNRIQRCMQLCSLEYNMSESTDTGSEVFGGLGVCPCQLPATISIIFPARLEGESTFSGRSTCPCEAKWKNKAHTRSRVTSKYQDQTPMDEGKILESVKEGWWADGEDKPPGFVPLLYPASRDMYYVLAHHNKS